MSKTTLHYIYDPLCGWCYAAAPLIDAARQVDGLEIVMHAGGLWTGAHVKKVTLDLRAYVMPNDQRIHDLTGQLFGDDYFNGLLNDTTAVFDSEPPIRAILAAKELNGKGLDMLHALQIAHFVDGRHISRIDTLREITGELGWNQTEFNHAFEQTITQAHLAESQTFMQQVGAQGFPNLVLERDGQLQRINHSQFYGQTDGFKTALQAALS